MASLDYGPIVWSDDFDYNGAPNASLWEFETGEPSRQMCGSEFAYGGIHFNTRDNAKAHSSDDSHDLLSSSAQRKMLANNERMNSGARGGASRTGNGELVIEARKVDNASDAAVVVGHNGKRYEYTSSKLRSKRAFKYGIFEIRCKLLNAVSGSRVGFMLLPSLVAPGSANKTTSSDAHCDAGEIHVLESEGRNEPGTIAHDLVVKQYRGLGRGGFHTPRWMYSNLIDASGYHTFAVHWKNTSMSFYVDGIRTYKVYKGQRPYHHDAWRFDNYAYNVVVFLGLTEPIGQTDLDKARFEIDYVRVYESLY